MIIGDVREGIGGFRTDRGAVDHYIRNTVASVRSNREGLTPVSIDTY